MLKTYQLINSACCLRWYKDNTQLLDVTEYVPESRLNYNSSNPSKTETEPDRRL